MYYKLVGDGKTFFDLSSEGKIVECTIVLSFQVSGFIHMLDYCNRKRESLGLGATMEGKIQCLVMAIIFICVLPFINKHIRLLFQGSLIQICYLSYTNILLTLLLTFLIIYT